MNIQLIPHHEIDKTKWNSCVHYAGNGNVFGYKWYLDTVAKEWDGLVEGDYESVMPLFLTDKENTLKQPALIREAGIYSIHVRSAKRIRAFLEAIPEQYQNIDLKLNEGNLSANEEFGFQREVKNNHQLFLGDSYEQLEANFLPTVAQELSLAENAELLPASNLKPEKVAELFKTVQPRSRENETSFHAYQRIMYNALHRGWGTTQGVTDRAGNLLAATFILYSHSRAMLLLTPVSPQGQQQGAASLMMDNLLRSHAGRPMILDFNGNKDLATSFGAQTVPYVGLERKGKRWWKVWE